MASDLAARVSAWRSVLSPWIAALWERLSLDIPEVPDSEELNSLWIKFNAGDKADSRGAWLAWLEAFELLDILALMENRVCWDILLDLCNVKQRLPVIGCSLEHFYGIRPRYEFSFTFQDNFFPRQPDVIALISSGIAPNDHTPEYTAAKADLLKYTGPRRRSPLSLRWRFTVPPCSSTDKTQQARYYGRFKHILALARAISTTPPLPYIFSFGFCSDTHTSNEARNWLRQIACVIPVDTMMLCDPRPQHAFHNNFLGPFLWRMLAPHPTRRAHLGLQSISACASLIQEPECIVGVYSALAYSQTLREVNCSHQDGYRSAAWLSFALFSKAATHRIRMVSLTLSVGEKTTDFVKALRDVVEHTNPVAYMRTVEDGDGVAKTLVHCPPTQVCVNAQTPIHVRDHLRSVKTVYHGKQTVVCHVADKSSGEFVRVLIPGVGFGRIHRKDVLSETSTKVFETHAVRSLALSFVYTDIKHVVSILQLVGAPLKKLRLTNTRTYRKGTIDRLTEILAACPLLEQLTLVNLSLPINRLLPSRWGRHLRSLRLISCHFRTDDPHYKLCLTQKMAPGLTSLLISTRCSVDDGISIRAFAVALLTTQRLERLVLHSPRGDTNVPEENAALTARYHGQRLPGLLLRQKLAVLSGVTIGTRFLLPNELILLVLEMAAVPVQQRYCAMVS